MNASVEGIFLGHAGFYLAHKNVRALIDPWFSVDGAFYGSWHQWPENSFVIEKFPEIFTANLLWISHEHPDHFDEKFLCTLDKKMLVVIPRFPSRRMYSRIKNIGFENIRELSHFESLEVESGIVLTMAIETPSYTEHSSMHFQFGNIGVFHNSDSSFSVADLEHLAAKLDTQLYIGQYSVTSPFPNVMNWPEEQKSPHRINHLTWSIARFIHGAKYLGAKFAIPCAGPALVLCEQALSITKSEITNEDGGYADNVIFNRILQQAPGLELCPMQPGQSFSVKADGVFYNKLAPLTMEQRLEQFDVIRKKRSIFSNQPTVSSDIYKLLLIHQKKFLNAEEKCTKIFDNFNFKFSVYLKDYDKRLEIDFTKETIKSEVQDGKLSSSVFSLPIYEIELESGLWADLLNEHSNVVFDDINYSQRFNITQSEGGYSGDFITVLRSFHDDQLLAVVNREYLCRSDETIDIEYCGVPYKIKRYCPHLGLDLLGHTLNFDGTITCKGHGWRFDVVTGDCVFGDLKKSIRGIN